MIPSRWLVIPMTSALCIVGIWAAIDKAPAQGPSTALICRGPLATFRTDGGKLIRTPFKWAKQAAGKENPAAGECAWVDRTPEAAEIKPDNANAVVGNLGPFDNLPVGTFAKICVNKAN